MSKRPMLFLAAFAFIAVALIAAGFMADDASARVIHDEGDFSYELNDDDDTAAVRGLAGDPDDPDVVDGVIPGTVTKESETYTVTSIQDYAFSDATRLKGSLTIPGSVETIGAGAFRGCAGLAEIAIPDSVTYISDKMFEGCTGLADITISGPVETIGNSAFEGCTGLAGITIPDSVTHIGMRAFWHCTNLEYIELPVNLTTMGVWALENCESLDISVAEGNKHFRAVDGVLYNHSMEKLIWFPVKGTGLFVVPASVKTIGNRSFAYSNLKQVVIPTAVELKCYAFYSSKLKALCLHGDTAAEVATYLNAFTGSDIDLTVIFGDRMSDSLKTALTNTGTLIVTSYKIRVAHKVPGCSHATVRNDPGAYVMCGYNDNDDELYAAAVCEGYTFDGWYSGGSLVSENPYIVLEAGTDIAPRCVFTAPEVGKRYLHRGIMYEVTALGPRPEASVVGWRYYSGHVHIPETWDGTIDGETYAFTVTQIGDSALCPFGAIGAMAYPYYPQSPPGIASVSIPWTVTHIGKEAFAANEGLWTAEFRGDSTLSSIGDFAFAGCAKLQSMELPSGLEWLGKNPFAACTHLDLTVAPGNEWFRTRDGVLYDKETKHLIWYPPHRTGGFTVPEDVETVRICAFALCKLDSVELPAGIEIMEGAFVESEVRLVSLHSDTVLGERVFNHCDVALLAIDGEGMSDSLREFLTNQCGGGTFVATSYEVPAGERNPECRYAAVNAGTGGRITYSVDGGVAKVTALGNAGHLFSKWTGTLESTEQTIGLADGMNVVANYAIVKPSLDEEYDYEGIRYKVTAIDGFNVKVDVISNDDGYEGAIAIPGAWTGIAGDDTYTFNVTGIAKKAFSNCPGLIAVTFGDDSQIETIGDSAFWHSTNLEHLKLPASLTTLGKWAFENCESLDIAVAEGNGSFKAVDGVLYDHAMKKLVWFPVKRTGYFVAPESVETIGDSAFAYSRLTGLTMPSPVELEEWAFFISKLEMLRLHGDSYVVWGLDNIRLLVIDGDGMSDTLKNVYAGDGLLIVTSYEVSPGDKNPRYLYATVGAGKNCYVGYSVEEGAPRATAAPTQGYEFCRWSDGAETATRDIGDGTNATALAWCDVTFKSLGAPIGEPVRVVEGGACEKPADPARDGYLLTGWMLGDVILGEGDWPIIVTGHATLVAKWSADPTKGTYDVLSEEDAASVLGCGAENPVLNLVGEGTEDMDMTGILSGFAGKSVTMNLPDGGGTWKLSGGKAAGAGTFRPAVSKTEPTADMKDASGGFGNALYLEFSASGALPFAKNEFTFAKADWMRDGGEYDVYLWDAAAKEFVEKGKATVAGGKATMSLEHCSVFAVAEPAPAVGGNAMLYAGVAIAIVAVIAVIALFVYPGILRKR